MSMHGKARENFQKVEREGLKPGFARGRKPVLSRAYQNRVAAESEAKRRLCIHKLLLLPAISHLASTVRNAAVATTTRHGTDRLRLV
jgi:hypothetical protein